MQEHTFHKEDSVSNEINNDLKYFLFVILSPLFYCWYYKFAYYYYKIAVYLVSV